MPARRARTPRRASDHELRRVPNDSLKSARPHAARDVCNARVQCPANSASTTAFTIHAHLHLGCEPRLAHGRAARFFVHRPSEGAAGHSCRARSSCPPRDRRVRFLDHRLRNRALDVLLRQRPPERGKLQFIEPLENASLPPRLDANRFSARRVEGNLVARLETPRLAMLSGQGDLTFAGDRRENSCRPSRLLTNRSSLL